MAYDELLAERVRELLQAEPGYDERKMFGGIAFMLGGHMCCGVVGDELTLRLGADGASRALEEDHVRPMDFTGRPMANMVFVAPEALHGSALDGWVQRGLAFVRTLPPKG